MDKNFYRAFEERFRGSRETVKARLEVYRPLLASINILYPGSSALDLGCGRGEWLELLQESGFSPLGIDQDEGMLSACIEHGLPTKNGDALDYLKNLAPSSHAIISALHVVEHISFEKLQSLIADALKALLPGGLLILETPNPENLNVGAHTFHLDPTHVKPIPPNLLSFLCEYHGFSRVKLLRLQASSNNAIAGAPTLIDVLIGSSADYAIIAQKTAMGLTEYEFNAILSGNSGFDVVSMALRYEDKNIAAILEGKVLLQTLNVTIAEQKQFNVLLNQSIQRFDFALKEFRDKQVWRTYHDLNVPWHTHLYRSVVDITTFRKAPVFVHLGRALKTLVWGRDQRPDNSISAIDNTRPTNVDPEPFNINEGERRPKSLFIDVSITCHNDYKTGIQRVVRALTHELMNSTEHGFTVVPIYQAGDGYYWHYKQANNWLLVSTEGAARAVIEDTLVTFQAGDVYLVADLTGGLVVQAERAGLYNKLRAARVSVGFIAYDILPIHYPHFFPAETHSAFIDWLKSASRSADFMICISNTVKCNLSAWFASNVPLGGAVPLLGSFRLGSDIKNSIPSAGVPPDAVKFIEKIKSAPTFIMVGMLEPRKGHADILAAFSLLWAKRHDINLVFIGNTGWSVNSLMLSVKAHPELGQHFHHLTNVSDEFLELIYSNATCLIAASYDEGFGLPIVEAAQKKMPVIARDIRVFREVAGDHVHYFNSRSIEGIASSIEDWLSLYSMGCHPKSENLKWLTWKESSQELLAQIMYLSPQC
ncbi:MAG: glycosyltransferase [Opitutus sp.]|nr:glycosyltransferase [Opitutus sp.]MCS6277743.1 glycosyltransferase [Opitutus sp.]MCS6299152.1 glycosyltransferase [Opitutus sp.]